MKESAIRRVVERQTCLTPELPVHIVLVPPLLIPPLLLPPLLVQRLLNFQALVPPLLRLQALVRYRWCNVNRIAFAILWIALGSFVFARCGGYKKAQDFTRAGHRIVQSTLLHSFFAAPEAYKRTFIRRIHHNEVEQDTFYLQQTQLTTLHQSIQSTVFPHYNGVLQKSE